MKFKLLLLSFLTILSACKKADSDTNPNTNAQNVDYEFTITINGLSHKIKGNTVNGDPTLLGPTLNKCYNSGGFVTLETNDISEFNYLSGKVLKCSILFQNYPTTLGVNKAELHFWPTDYWNELADSLGCYYNAFSITNDGNLDLKIPITITDLGNARTTTNGILYNHTKTCKGNFNRTLYMMRIGTGKYDVPVNISIDFKAVRIL
jgi:hypothetical protein